MFLAPIADLHLLLIEFLLESLKADADRFCFLSESLLLKRCCCCCLEMKRIECKSIGIASKER